MTTTPANYQERYVGTIAVIADRRQVSINGRRAARLAAKLLSPADIAATRTTTIEAGPNFIRKTCKSHAEAIAEMERIAGRHARTTREMFDRDRSDKR